MTPSVEEVVYRLREPLRSAHGEVRERRILLLRLRDGDGAEGLGEAAPLESYDGVSLDACRDALESACAVLRETRDRALALRTVAPLAPAAAAVDVAFWNLAAAQTGRPVWSLLGAEREPAVELNATLGGADPVAEAAAAVAAGFDCVKVKVGIEDDAGRVAAVRDALGRGPRLRIDANGAWTVEEAPERLRELAPFDIELCEEPVHGVEALRAVRAASPIPIALDETATAPNALVPGVADFACLKLAAWGGISGLVAAARHARTAGLRVYIASTLDGPVGIAAARDAAALIRPDAACGLATLALFEDS